MTLTGAGKKSGHIALPLALTFAMMVGPLQKAAVGALGPLILIDLEIEPTSLGWLASLAAVASALLAVLFAPWVDRVAPLTLMGFVFLLGLGGTVLTAMASGVASLALAFILAAGAEAQGNPATNRLINTSTTSSLGILVGLKQAGVKLGLLIAGGLLPVLAGVTTWRFAVAASGVFALVGLVALRATRAAPRILTGQRTADHGESAREMRTDRGPWILATYSGLMAMAQSPFTLYVSVFAVATLDLSLERAGLGLALSGLVGIAIRLLAPWLLDQLIDDESRRTQATLSAMALGTFLSLVLLSTPSDSSFSQALFLIGCAFFGLTAGGWNAVIHYKIVADSPIFSTGRHTSIVHSSFLIGRIVGPLVFAGTLSLQLGYQTAWLIAGIPACCAAALMFNQMLRDQPSMSKLRR